MAEPTGAHAWVFVREGAVPARWRSRAVPVLLVPLLPDEAEKVLGGVPAEPGLDPADERIAGLLARGLSEKDIAAELDLNIRTVQRRLMRLRGRYGAATTRELAVLLASRGF